MSPPARTGSPKAVRCPGCRRYGSKKGEHSGKKDYFRIRPAYRRLRSLALAPSWTLDCLAQSGPVTPTWRVRVRPPVIAGLGLHRCVRQLSQSGAEKYGREEPLRLTERLSGARTRRTRSCSSSPRQAPMPKGIGTMSKRTLAGSCDARPTFFSSSRNAHQEQRSGTRFYPQISSTSAEVILCR